MINRVISDLRVFLLFYSILVLVFSMIFAIIGVGNKNIEGAFKEAYEKVDGEGMPNEEYEQIGLFLGYIFMTLRYSLGDFDF